MLKFLIIIKSMAMANTLPVKPIFYLKNYNDYKTLFLTSSIYRVFKYKYLIIINSLL